jgi:arylsulfatase A-like enzyme
MLVRQNEWKLLHNDKIGRIELYNISKDLFEQHNLSDENPEKVTELKGSWKE